MKDVLLTSLFWLGLICFLWASGSAINAQITYVARTGNFLSLFFSAGLHNWKDFSDKEKQSWKTAFKLLGISFICSSVSLLNSNSKELTLLSSSIRMIFP